MKGYTLIEIVATLIIVGLIMMTLMGYLRVTHQQLSFIKQHTQQTKKAVLAKHLLTPAISNTGFTGCLTSLHNQPSPFWQIQVEKNKVKQIQVSHLWPLDLQENASNSITINQLHPRINKGDRLVLTDCHQQKWLTVTHVSVDFSHNQQLVTVDNAVPTIKSQQHLYLWQTIRFTIAPSKIASIHALYRQVNHGQRQEVLSGIESIQAQCQNANQQWQSCRYIHHVSQLKAVALTLTIQSKQVRSAVKARQLQLIIPVHGYEQTIT